MMRVLVLGNSHAATLRRAFPAFGTAVSDVQLGFWGLPGAAFAKAATGPDGHVRPDPTDRVSRRKVTTWNDAESVNLAGFDRIFLVGLRYGLRNVLQMMRRLQPLNWGRRSGALGVSDRFLRAAVRAEVETSLTAQVARTPFDARFVAMPAPYPAVSATALGALHDPALTAVAALEHAAALLDLFEDEIAAAHAALGVPVVMQPRTTLARPWLSADDYLEEPGRDARHLNASYGLVALKALMAAPPALSAAPVAVHTTV